MKPREVKPSILIRTSSVQAAHLRFRRKLEQRQQLLSLVAAVDHLHRLNAVSLPDERRFSFGCVQVVNVVHCQRLALALAAWAAEEKTVEALDIRVVCLHGRLSLATRNWIDGQLNRMLCRKGGNGDLAPLANPFVRDFVAGSSCLNIAVILVSTLETTGRESGPRKFGQEDKW